MMSTLALPLIESPQTAIETPDGVLPLDNGKNCGTGCSSTKNHEVRTEPFRDTGSPTLQIPFAERRLNLDAVPSTGMILSGIDMDLTVECNLRCTYCFKEKWTEHMEEQVAFDTLVWLIHASGPVKNLSVAFMGGEPLIRFKLIKKIVPFAKRRASQYGKSIHFTMTTNGTLVTDEVVAFWKRWGLSFHTSIDGTPEIQDRNRPTTGGRGSARLVEKAVPRILAYQPWVTARSTVVPANAGAIVASYKYFRSLGYTEIAFVPGSHPDWVESDINLYEDQFRDMAVLLMDDLRAGHRVRVKGIEGYAQGQMNSRRPPHPCGAGRGMVLVDIHGDLWPCHRWNKATHSSWRIGSIYEQFNDAIRSPLDSRSFVDDLENDCAECPANTFCSGGCPAENLEQTGTVHRRHPKACELTRVWSRVGKYVYETMMAEGNEAYRDVYLTSPNGDSE